MSADFSKIIDHPLAEEIVDKLVHGTRPKDVSDWLKLKFPEKDQSHLRLDAMLLQRFLDSNLDLYQTLKKDIEKNNSGGKIDKKTSEALLNNKSYKDRLNELADNEIDINKMLSNALKILEIRLEQVYDIIQTNPLSTKGGDYVILKYFDSMGSLVEKFHKIVNNGPDQIIQHNVTVQVMDQYVQVLQDSVRDILAEMDPDLAFTFMDKLNARMANVKLPEEVNKVLPQEARLKEAKLLLTKLEKDNSLEEPGAPNE